MDSPIFRLSRCFAHSLELDRDLLKNIIAKGKLYTLKKQDIWVFYVITILNGVMEHINWLLMLYELILVITMHLQIQLNIK